MTQNQIKEIMDMLNTLQEHLLSLPDDMLLNIDPRDNESIENGMQFIIAFNESLNQFVDSTSKIEKQIKSHFRINPEEDDIEKETANRSKRERIVQELDTTTRYSLDENFTYKRPYGFILGETAYKGIKTWKNLYLNVLQVLNEKDSGRFSQLPDNENFVSTRGNNLFSRNKELLRAPAKLEAGFYAEINLSANQITKNIKILLEHFGFDYRNMKIYLREYRDATS